LYILSLYSHVQPDDGLTPAETCSCSCFNVQVLCVSDMLWCPRTRSAAGPVTASRSIHLLPEFVKKAVVSCLLNSAANDRHRGKQAVCLQELDSKKTKTNKQTNKKSLLCHKTNQFTLSKLLYRQPLYDIVSCIFSVTLLGRTCTKRTLIY
jgi:hypothetical protein